MLLSQYPLIPHEGPWKDTPVTNGLMHQFGCDGAIDAAADGAYDPTGFATNLADASDFFPYKFFLPRGIV
jgi:hypothetical protein